MHAANSKPKTKKAAASELPQIERDFPIPFVTRKTPVVLLYRLLLVAFVFEALYILLRILLPENPFIGDVWTFVILAAVQLGVALYLLLDWFMETYEVHKEDIHHNRGILFRREETYPYNNMQSITCKQSPLGRIFHYGEVRIFIPTLGQELAFAQVPHPHHFITTVRHILPYPDQQRFIISG
jgi:membrane protein YdbS with pleckstrin-like domain